MKIKVGYIVSYDYNMFLTSVRQIYKEVNEIYLAIDSNFETWSGNKFNIPNSFFEEIKKFDIDSKIEIYRDKFYIAELMPMECETRERNMLLSKMGKGWLIQLDVDEYLYDFKKLKKYLKSYWYLQLFPKLTPIAFKGSWITLFKEVEGGFLYIENNENFDFITNYSYYHKARSNKNIERHFTNFKVIHQSWARSDEQIKLKISNWGHRDDFDTKKYFKYWENISKENYKEYNNFHPIAPKIWNKLYFMKSEDINDFITKYAISNPQKLVGIPIKNMIIVLIKKILKKCWQ